MCDVMVVTYFVVVVLLYTSLSGEGCHVITMLAYGTVHIPDDKVVYTQNNTDVNPIYVNLNSAVYPLNLGDVSMAEG